MDKTRNPSDRVAAEERLSDQGYEHVRRRQVRLGLKLTPAERLRWLEEAIRTFGRWRGRAAKSAGGDGPSGHNKPISSGIHSR